jgi:glutaconyl-CoA/methylmalonyl-CoA decarboxylase subunit gamma
MKYQVTLDGEKLEVELLEQDGGLVVVHEGRAIPVELCHISRNGSYSLKIGDRSLPLVASGPNDALVLNLSSETWNASVMDAREAAAAEAEGARTKGRTGGLVNAVMPGIVRELRVAVGGEVAPGDTLLILEAMKMQNEIRADAAGTITAVHVEVGQAVAKGDKLVIIG